MTGSVMDYNPINIAPKGQKQGDYTTTTIGPYDYWAIEYAYKPIDGDEDRRAQEDRRPVARSRPGLRAPTTTLLDNDPQINTYDLTNDTLAFGKQRIAMATELLKDLDQKVVRDSESWSRLRAAFRSCISQFGNGAYLASEYIGGQSVSRDFKGSDKAPRSDHADQRCQAARGPFDAGRPDPQRQVLPVLAGPAPQADHRIVAGQPLLLLGGMRLSDLPDDPEHPGDRARPVPRLERAPANPEPGAAERSRVGPAQDRRDLPVALRRHLLGARRAAGRTAPFTVSTIRRNLQREYVKRLSNMVLGPRNDNSYGQGYRYIVFYGDMGSAPPDAKNLARLHLEEIGQKIDKLIGQKDRKIDDTSLAHLKEIGHRIDRVLKANLNANEP